MTHLDDDSDDDSYLYDEEAYIPESRSNPWIRAIVWMLDAVGHYYYWVGPDS